jgi:hypothetical protein
MESQPEERKYLKKFLTSVGIAYVMLPYYGYVDEARNLMRSLRKKTRGTILLFLLNIIYLCFKIIDIWDDEPPYMVKIFRKIRRTVLVDETNISKLKNFAINFRYAYYIFDIKLDLGNFEDEKLLKMLYTFLYSITDKSRLVINKIELYNQVSNKLRNKIIFT